MSFSDKDQIRSARLSQRLLQALYVTSLKNRACYGFRTDEYVQTIGSVPAVKGYFAAMKAVCERHGALLIMDEVMSGMGRTGTLHAWEQEGVVPDLQTVAKGLGAGYAPIGALLVNDRIVKQLEKGTGGFQHSQTYQGHPVACAAALEVQKIVEEEDLLSNVLEMGDYLESSLKRRLERHEHVGDVRGRGLFWGVSSLLSCQFTLTSAVADF
jgi:adenosylmethionine-8-amino-7-oxononanoate aminotransferase